MFHVTNVTTTIDLTGVTLVNAEDSDVLLSATQDSWGNSGLNGGHVTMDLNDQTAEGDMIVDSASSLTLKLNGSSAYTGAVNAANEGSVAVTIAEGATWTLTGDSYVDSIDGDLSGLDLNGYTLYVNGEAYNG